MRPSVRRLMAWSVLAGLLVAPVAWGQEEKQGDKKEAKKEPAKAAAKQKTDEELKKDLRALNNVRSDEAINKKIKDLSDDKVNVKRLIQLALPLTKEKDDAGLNYSAAHILGVLALDLRENKAAIEFLKIAIDKANKVKSERKVSNNRMFLVEAYLADNKGAEAEKVAEKMISPSRVDPENTEELNAAATTMFFGRNLLVRATMMQGAFDKAQKHLEWLEKTFLKDNDATPAAKGMIQRTKAYFLQYKGDLKESIKVYEELADEAENDEERDRYREQIGNLYADLGDVDKAYDLMSGLLKKTPDNAGLNNDLGYILAVHDRKLDEAEKMVKKAIEKEPDNSSFLDSMAWVYFKQKKYQQAKDWMMKAVAQERGRNTELMEHLGDIEKALGKPDEAKKAYEKALAAVTPNFKDKQRKPEIEKKLKELGK